MTRQPDSPAAAAASMPRALMAHLDQLDQIDQTYWWHRVRWRAIRHCIARFGKGNAFTCYFDIGSGGGGLPGLLIQDVTFGQIVLFDHHEVKAGKINHPNVTQRFVDLEAFDGRGCPAPDFVTCLDVLEHLKNPGQLLRGLQQVASGRQALLIVTVPAMSTLWSWWDEQAGHYRRYSASELRRLLEASGWRVLDAAYFFHAAVIPILLHRWKKGNAGQRLEFPVLPGWLNWGLERVFWTEYRLTRWCRLPFGSSLIAVAQPSSR